MRHPDPVPCPNCALGEWDMCRNGRYTERGIKQADGFAAERWRSEPGFTVKVSPMLGLAAVLLEPASVLAKAWEHIERIGRRARWAPQTVLVTGAGPVGLLAALMGVQRGLDVHVLDRNESGPKPELVRELGATYHRRFPAVRARHRHRVHRLAGDHRAGGHRQRAGQHRLPDRSRRRAARCASFDVAKLNQSMVLENRVVFGSVNANLRHYHAAAEALAHAESRLARPPDHAARAAREWQRGATRSKRTT